MTSQEALKLAILEYEKDLEFDKNNQWVKNVLKGLKECQKDLKVLEILKKNEISISYKEQNISYDDYMASYSRNLSYMTIEEQTLLKEWLENE